MRLAAILVVGFALRLAYLLHVALQPGFRWHDPDFYLRGGRQLAEGPHGWHWTFDAVTLWIGGRRHMLPPLYPVFLSLFASFPHLPLTALLGQLALSVGAIVLIFDLGRRLHSRRTGLIAAGGFALWDAEHFQRLANVPGGVVRPTCRSGVRTAGGGARVDDGPGVVPGGCGIWIRGVDPIDAALLPAARGRTSRRHFR